MNSGIRKYLSLIEENILSFSIIIMAILLIVAVIMRTIFNNSLTFTEEVSSALLVLVSFFGLGYCARKARHITMSIVFDIVNNKTKKIFMVLISLISSISVGYISFLAIRYVLSVKNLGRVTAALQIPMYIIYAIVPIGFILVCIEYISVLYLNIKDKDRLYISSEVNFPMELEMKGDLSSIIDKLSEESDGD